MKTLLLILISFSCYAGTDTTSDATILVSIEPEINGTNPQVRITTGASAANVPSAQEHIDAIQSYIQELINPHLIEALAKDPDVLKIKQELLAKEQELAAEIKRKVDEVNGARG